ncbi:hypothetical protein D3C80_1091100 [compost metagenome]
MKPETAFGTSFTYTVGVVFEAKSAGTNVSDEANVLLSLEIVKLAEEVKTILSVRSEA